MCYTPVVGTKELNKSCCKNSLVVTKIYILKEKSQNMSLAHIYYKTIWYYIEPNYKVIKSMNYRGLGLLLHTNVFNVLQIDNIVVLILI